MKSSQKIWMLSALALTCSSMASAATIPFIETNSVSSKQPVVTGGTTTLTTESMSVRDTVNSKMIAPYYGNDKTYTLDQQAAKNMLNQKSSLIKVNCNNLQVLKDLGLGQSNKVTSISVGEDIFDYNFDFKNCSLRGNKRDYTRSNKPLTEDQALTFAKNFMKSGYLSKKVFAQYGAPVVLSKNGNNPRPYLLKETNGQASEDISLSGIEIDPNDTGYVTPEYTSFSIVFPYTLNGTPIYNAYGNKAGITLEVNAEGVTSVNAQLLPFKGAARNAEKLAGDDLVKFVQRGGNSSFRGQEKEVKLSKPQRVLVLFNLWRNNTNELYMSSGIRFASDIKTDQRSTQNYEMIVSDYKIGNSNLGN